MADSLDNLRALLARGMKLSKQGSYNRRAPAPESIPWLERARDGLRRFVNTHNQDATAWRLLSQAEECLLNFEDALEALHKAIALSPKPDRSEIRRISRLKEQITEWSDLMLTPGQVSELGQFLANCGANQESLGHTLRHTREWLNRNTSADTETIIEALARRGAFSDFQVFYNVVRG